MRTFRRLYGAQPLHLVAAAICFFLIAEGIIGWIGVGSDARGVLTWFVGSLAGSQVVLVAGAWLWERLRRLSPRRVNAGAHLWVPALLSLLLLLVFLPLIGQFGAVSFGASTGLLPTGFLIRWLYITAGLFAASGLVFAGRTVARRSMRRTRV